MDVKSREIDEIDGPGPPRSAQQPAPVGWNGRGPLRWVVSLWLIYHFSAVVIAPAAISPSSELIQGAWRFFQPYLQYLSLNNGYHFFAPEPTETTLVYYEAERADGTTVKGQVPDRRTAPRLLYHRNFMLTEQLKYVPPLLLTRWYDSYAQHIGHKLGATSVKLTRVVHYPPTRQMFLDGMRLDDPELYEELPVGTFTCRD